MGKKQRIVVLGGSSGMGFAIAKMMFDLDYEVTICSRSLEKLEKARKEIGKVDIHAADLKVESDVIQLFSKIDPFDHLVITAADFYMGSFVKGETSDARTYFESKFWGQFYAAKHAVPKMRKGGSIIFFGGAASEKPMNNFATGGAINAAIEGLTRSLALELAPLRVNTISPGFIVTPIWETVPDKDKVIQDTSEKLPVKRIGYPEDIAQGARFLIECGFVTGEVLHIDGGHRLI